MTIVSTNHQRKTPKKATRAGASPLLQRERPIYPFTAIVGQEELKLALQLCVIEIGRASCRERV